jgi:hypothetical protein
VGVGDVGFCANIENENYGRKEKRILYFGHKTFFIISIPISLIVSI